MTDEKKNVSMDVHVSDQCNELFAALSAFQGQAAAPKKSATNPHFKSKFADLADVMDAARDALAKNKLCLTQLPVGTCESTVRVVTILGHASGQWIKGVLDMPLPKKSPQDVGSAVSYARRYCAMAVLGLAAEDDDAETAEGRGNGGQRAPAQSQQRQQPATGKDPGRVLTTLRSELEKVGDAEKLAMFMNHAQREMQEAGVGEQPKNDFWKAWGDRCKALGLEPKSVADAARAQQQRAA